MNRLRRSLLTLFIALFSGVTAATTQLFSGLGQPLLAKVTLEPAEWSAERLELLDRDGRSDFQLLRLPNHQGLLILSEGVVSEPILQLQLLADGRQRRLVLLLEPLPTSSAATLLTPLLQQWEALADQYHSLERQLQHSQHRSEVREQEQQQWLQTAVTLGLLLLLLLIVGGGVWWRRAEPLELGPSLAGVAATASGAGTEFDWQQFTVAVERI